jgi:hypothetical protein
MFFIRLPSMELSAVSSSPPSGSGLSSDAMKSDEARWKAVGWWARKALQLTISSERANSATRMVPVLKARKMLLWTDATNHLLCKQIMATGHCFLYHVRNDGLEAALVLYSCHLGRCDLPPLKTNHGQGTSLFSHDRDFSSTGLQYKRTENLKKATILYPVLLVLG